MDKMVEDYTIIRGKEIQKLVHNVERIKELLEKYFEFNIPNYVIFDIAEHETYSHICLMINVARMNGRISEENAVILKQELKQLLDLINDNNVESIIIK